MPHTTHLRKVGGSVMLAIPPALLDALDLKPDAKVGMSVRNGKLLVEPRARARYSLDALLAQCDAGEPESDDLREWQDAPPVGQELL
jgi:antitoxin ChpS